jgi:hypothetical protein
MFRTDTSKNASTTSRDSEECHALRRGQAAGFAGLGAAAIPYRVENNPRVSSALVAPDLSCDGTAIADCRLLKID